MNEILGWFNPTRWLVLAVLLAVLAASVMGYGEWRAHKATVAESQRWELAVGKMKTEAATKLAEETTKVLALERALATATAQREADYEKRRMDSQVAQRDLGSIAARNGGRLRDPNAGRGCGGGGAAPATAAGAAGRDGPGAEASGVLSTQLGGLLQRLTAEADAVNDAYSLCRADAQGLRRQVNAAP